MSDMELIQLLEVEVDSWGPISREVRNYELYSCDMVKAVTHSANAYWHRRVDMKELGIREENVLQTAKFWMTSDGGRVGGWETYEDAIHFLTFYMRGTILVQIVTEENHVRQ